MIAIWFRCGHGLQLPDADSSTPVCLTCGERRIERVQAPRPRFTGYVRGPLGTPKDLEPARVVLAASPLRLKGDDHAA